MEALKNLFFNIASLIPTVSVWDILDIVIIAYLIYRILAVMRRTSTGSVIKGIIFLLAVVWLSSLMNLNVVSYLMDQMLQMGVIILIILFQPELRKFFEQMGSRSLSTLFKRRVKLENVESGIHNIVAACSAMSKTKTGALIVFEREIGLRDYAATGTIVDAFISTELVENIFYHNTPLHDGAMIIKDGRITAAGCMLPMSNNINISRELGMRHRAGIGISERSDAVAVIVSEETGAISVAIDGMLKRHLAKDTFEQLLKNELIYADAAKSAKGKSRGIKVKK